MIPLVHEPETRMVVTEIVLFSLGQVVSVIPPTPLTSLILPPKSQNEGSAPKCRKPRKGQCGPKANGEGGSLARDINVAGHNTAQVAQSYLHGSADPSLVMTAEIVVHPHQS